MTIDEAIKHCEEVAERQEYLSKQNHGYCDEKRNIQKSEECADCAADHRQLAKWLTELKEAKRLLKLAVEDIHSRDYCNGCIYESAEGKEQYLNCEYHKCYKWRFADEAEKLLKED